MTTNKPADTISKFLPDIIIVVLYFFSTQMMQWQTDHPAASATMLMLLNIVAVGFGCFSFFSMYADDNDLNSYRNSLSKFQSSIVGLCAFISCLGFLWWLVPFAGLKALEVKDTGFFLGMTLYFIVFISTVALAMTRKENNAVASGSAIKAITLFSTTVFFFFAYCLLKMTMQHWQPDFIGSKLLAVLCLCIFYLPLRFFLLMRPPLSKWEYVSFVVGFGVVLAELFGD